MELSTGQVEASARIAAGRFDQSAKERGKRAPRRRPQDNGLLPTPTPTETQGHMQMQTEDQSLTEEGQPSHQLDDLA
jgi:hypothetical protein